MATPRILLVSNSTQHGSGYLEHCAPRVREHFAGCASVAFVPYALADHDAYAATAAKAFAALGLELRSVHAGQPLDVLAAADGVFIGGGNTFRLLRALWETGLREAVKARVASGMPYLGTSAGSNVACPTICTTNDMPIVQPPSFRALGLVPFQLNPHYLDPAPGSKHMGETRETRIREYHEEQRAPVVGLREGGMLRVHGGAMTLLGPPPARVFRRGEPAVEYPSGSDLSFLL